MKEKKSNNKMSAGELFGYVLLGFIILFAAGVVFSFAFNMFRDFF